MQNLTGQQCFLLMVAVIWISAAIGSAFTKNAKPFDYAIGTTVLTGIGYYLLHCK